MTECSPSPRVSIIIPLYNHERFIGEALRSVLSQTFTDFEVIVIDDGSTDRSPDIVRAVQDDRLRFFRQENQGASRTLNRGIELSRGAFIAILNSDDIFYPERIGEALRAFEEDPSTGAVVSHLEFIDEEGTQVRSPVGPDEYWTDQDPETSFRGTGQIVLNLLAGNFLITSSNLICRREVFDDIGLFSDLRYTHDYDLFLRLCLGKKVHLIERPLLKYRLHGANTVKENEAAVSFEVGLVLSSFFLNHDLKGPLSLAAEAGGDHRDLVVRLFNSVNTYHTDRMVMTLLLYGRYFSDRAGSLIRDFGGSSSSALRDACMASLNRQYREWRHAQEGWDRWDETNKRLIAREQELSEAWKHGQEGWDRWDKTNKRLIGTLERLAEAEAAQAKAEAALGDMQAQMQAFLNSWSFRSGRALTWPLRKLRDVIRAGKGGAA